MNGCCLQNVSTMTKGYSIQITQIIQQMPREIYRLKLHVWSGYKQLQIANRIEIILIISSISQVVQISSPVTGLQVHI